MSESCATRRRTAEQSSIQDPEGKIYDDYKETICTCFKRTIFLHYSQTVEIPLNFRLFIKDQGRQGNKILWTSCNSSGPSKGGTQDFNHVYKQVQHSKEVVNTSP